MKNILESYDKKEENLGEKKEPKKIKKDKVKPKRKQRKGGRGGHLQICRSKTNV